MAGADKSNALMQSVIVGVANLVMTLVAMALIDRLGRKPLLLAGAVTFVISHALAALNRTSCSLAARSALARGMGYPLNHQRKTCVSNRRVIESP